MAERPYDRLDGVIWYDGKLVPWGDATVHVLPPRPALCELRCSRASAPMAARSSSAREHSERLKRSAQLLDFEIPYSVAEIDAAKRLVLEKNGQPNAYVRPIAWRGSEMMGVSAQNNNIHLAIATWQWPSYFDPAQRLKGIRLDLAEYRRPDPATAPARAKAAGLYMICTISKHKAERKGYADAMMLDWQGRVAECTGANIFFVKDGKIHTPIADCFLDGITRQTVIELARKRGIEVIERRIMPDELTQFHRVLHHRHRGGSHRGLRDRAVAVHARRHHQAADGRLHRRGAAQGQEGGGVDAPAKPISPHARRSWLRPCARDARPRSSEADALGADPRPLQQERQFVRQHVGLAQPAGAAQLRCSLTRCAALKSSITRRAG